MQKIMFSDRRIKYPQKSHPRKDVHDLTGRKFGNLTVLSRHRVQRIEGHKIWLEHGTYAEEWVLKKLTD